MKRVGPVLDKELSRWKAQLHIILEDLKQHHDQHRRRVQRQPSAATATSPPVEWAGSDGDEHVSAPVSDDDFLNMPDPEPSPENPNKTRRTEACVGTTQTLAIRGRRSTGTIMTQK
jgi:hypothetical protein